MYRHGDHAALVAVVILSLGLASRAPCRAQETTGAVEGTVTGPDGRPLAGVEVLATKPAQEVARRAVTNRDGAYRIAVLPLGEYEITIRDPAFQPVTVRQVVVRLGRTTAVPAVQLAAPGSLVEHVRVVGRAPPIDPTSTTTGGNVAAALFSNLPVQRDYQSIATLLPNVSASYLGDPVNFGGATGFENRYFVDGIEMTDPSRGRGGTVLPPDFIQEVEVKTGGYEAEYRSALGGIVNVVTPTGTDRLSGSFIGYWTSHLVTADPKQSPIEPQQRNFVQYDAGFSLSGPLVRERAWFFLAYDPQYQSVETELPGLGYYQDSTTAHRFAAKVDWRVNGANTLALTVVGDPTRRDGVGDLVYAFGTPVALLNPDPWLRRIETGGVGISVRGTHVLSPAVLLETSLSLLRRDYSNLPGTQRGSEEVMFSDFSTGVLSGGSTVWVDWRNTQWTAGVKATFGLGRHEVKAGLEYRDNGQTTDTPGPIWVDWLIRYSDTSWQSTTQGAEGTVHNRIPSLFVQDSWRIGSRWVLNAGLRWASERLVSDSGATVQTIDGEWQPRIGFVYQPGRIGTQRIYGSAARYYQELATFPIAAVLMGTGWSRWCTYDHDPRLDPGGGDCATYPAVIQDEVPGLHGNRYDEYSLGYQRQLGERHRAGVRAIYRSLGDAIEDSWVAAKGGFVWGNPGRGLLADEYPRASRVYRALELTVEGQPSPRSGYLASYVLSENRGNWTGMFYSDWETPMPNFSGMFDFPDLLTNGDGLLPNDRTHVLKGSGFYRFDSGLNVGASALWQSGTPLNEFGGSAEGYPNMAFLRQRGTAGRTPSIFDLSLRIDYTFLRHSPGRWKPRLILDVYHLFSGREPVDYDQFHYYNRDAEGNQIDPNPTYGMVKRYYPPATARLGLEVTF